MVAIGESKLQNQVRKKASATKKMLSGKSRLKQVRTQLVETARPALEALVADVTGIKPCSLHHDISTLTGEEIVVFTLSERPQFRETKKK